MGRFTSGMLEMTWPLAITKAGTPVAAIAEHMAYLDDATYRGGMKFDVLMMKRTFGFR